MPTPRAPHLNYPIARADNVVDHYHGTRVADPYRWLEDTTAPESRAWAAAQQRLTQAFLDAIPSRELIKARLTELWDHPRIGVPIKAGKRYFYTRNAGLQNQAVLFMQDGLDGEPVEILNPNHLSEDGTVALVNQSYSRDGALLAYGLSSQGSDWQEIRVRHIDTGEDYAEVLRWCKFTRIAWTHDSAGFFYGGYATPGGGPAPAHEPVNRLYWHTIGTPQVDDRLVYERPDRPELHFNPLITDDSRYLMLYVWHGAIPQNRIYYRELDGDGVFVRLLDEADAHYVFLGNAGRSFYFFTNLDAPHGRIIAIDLDHPAREHWREILPPQADVIDFARLIGDHLAVVSMHDAQHQLKLYTRQGVFVRPLTWPTPGSVVDLSGKSDDPEMFIGVQSFLQPTTIVRYDFATDELTPFHEPAVRVDASQFETHQVFYTSTDGTRVPMFLTHRQGLQRSGHNPTLLYGYGGFAVSLTPFFAAASSLWLEQEGILAVANLRGGNEYGEAWHQAGMLEHKQQVFDDFIAAAEWLIRERYTSSEQLAIMGRSNGGLLVASCMLQRPELFGAVVCGVPVTDMLRYHRFTAGRYWIAEYGNAETNPEHFRALYAYSPLHNVKRGVAYPSTLITTGDTDDRVVPSHAFKFAATLQAADSAQQPILLRVDTRAGHGLGKPMAKLIEEQADVYAFLFHTLRIAPTPLK
ncbi:MAG TPA: prolyl oligopeptidase family serine peptidase [Candidatus Tectomicrobia bacterium]|nr:prolyl oligopeptidase family serine peptidase [Candidatus Tectomicrobia bacterium]